MPPQLVHLGQAVHGRFGGPSTDKYRLPDLWCLHVYQYEATLELNGCLHRIYPGTASVVPPDTTMVYRYRGPSEHCYCHFRLGDLSEGGEVLIAAVQHVGSKPPEIYRRLSNAATQARHPGPRSQALVWDLLWLLSESDNVYEADGHPALLNARRLIEQNLAQPLVISEIARASGVSYGYLSRLFRAEFRTDVIGYIRQRRGQRAEHLLRSSTLSIKSVAASVGTPDLAQFNRLIHRTHGCSPSELRQLVDSPTLIL